MEKEKEKDDSKMKLYVYKNDPNRKIIEEENTIYEVDNQCILLNKENRTS